MRKLLGKIGKYLYFHFGEADVVAMTRAQLSGDITRYKIKSPVWKDKNKVKKLAEEADRFKGTKLYRLMFNELYAEEIDKMTLKAKTWKQNRNARRRIDGIYSVEQYLKKVATMGPPKTTPMTTEESHNIV